ncbi:hypothetical protein ACFYVL_09220 [Streptomyces sp. NPDC004111]|uniref:hypothetical protein n=1 Tax=Streptomyces sp. NPDC004111 TaxID=3364690 RepID=UPI0036959EA0
MTYPEPDLRLDGLKDHTGHFSRTIGLLLGDLTLLAEHHSPSGDSFHVLHDRSATWGIPGAPQIVALHLQRDAKAGTFRYESKELPLAPMAQSWLVARGCPPEAIALNPDLGPEPADDTTRALNKRLVNDGDHFACGYSYTRDDPDNYVVVVALRSMDEKAAVPYRVLVEEIDSQAEVVTLREGGFATVHDALQWCDDRLGGTAGPLPPVRPAASPARPSALPAAPLPPRSGRAR